MTETPPLSAEAPSSLLRCAAPRPRRLQAKTLENVPLLRTLPHDGVLALVARLDTLVLLPEDIIVSQGEEVGELFLLVEGSCSEFYHDGARRAFYLRTLHAGAVFGAPQIMGLQKESLSTITSEAFGEIQYVTRRGFREFLTALRSKGFENTLLLHAQAAILSFEEVKQSAMYHDDTIVIEAPSDPTENGQAGTDGFSIHGLRKNWANKRKAGRKLESHEESQWFYLEDNNQFAKIGPSRHASENQDLGRGGARGGGLQRSTSVRTFVADDLIHHERPNESHKKVLKRRINLHTTRQGKDHLHGVAVSNKVLSAMKRKVKARSLNTSRQRVHSGEFFLKELTRNHARRVSTTQARRHSNLSTDSSLMPHTGLEQQPPNASQSQNAPKRRSSRSNAGSVRQGIARALSTKVFGN